MNRRLVPVVTVALVGGTMSSCGSPPRLSELQIDDIVVIRAGDFRDNPTVLSPPILEEPIYECTDTVFAKGFVPNAEIKVYVGGTAAPIGSGRSLMSSISIKTSITFAKGQVLRATQTVGANSSGDSDAVTVRGVGDDYPGGLPRPRINPAPLYRCGKATGARDVLPGSQLEFISEPALPGGGFGPTAFIGGFGLPAVIAAMNGAMAAQWMAVAPAFGLGDRVRADYKICAQTSPRSNPEIVEAQPAAIPTPTVDQPYEGQQIIVVRKIANGAELDVYATASGGSQRIGGGPTPGGNGHEVIISPPAVAGNALFATQRLCRPSSAGTPITIKPCSELPAARVKPPDPGDRWVEVIESVPGSEIRIYASGQEIGDGGGSLIKLLRELAEGEPVSIVQSLGTCTSQWTFESRVRCHASSDPMACSSDWPAFGHDSTRRGQQPRNSVLANPLLVAGLKLGWQSPFTPPNPSSFRASPVVWKGVVYIGNGNGRFYAIDANTGGLLWQYPPAGQAALTSQFTSSENPSNFGIASSAAIARIGNGIDVVIFGAPDRSLPPGFGSGRLFALDAATGAEVWKSDTVAVLNGTTNESETEIHEHIGYSAPLVRNNKVYIGTSSHGDNPLENGKVKAVDLATGAAVAGFSFRSTSSRGGGVWSSVAAGPTGELYVTTGNTKRRRAGDLEPVMNRGLSMLRLDPSSGAVSWKFQPVPWELDADPDWAAGAIALKASCGTVAVSTQKDGWSYAVEAEAGGTHEQAIMRWQFPATGLPFPKGSHGDLAYRMRGAAWNDVFVTMTGGWDVVATPDDSYRRLHGLNVCSGPSGRVRWLLDVPGAVDADTSSLPQVGPPTVTRGIFFVGTAQGHLLAFADPDVKPGTGMRCSNAKISDATCAAQGFALVPQPAVLANIALDAAGIFTEPALADGRVFVATDGGHVFMLQP